MAKHIVFLDSLGRSILGELVEQRPDKLVVQNPAILHAGINPGNKIQVSLVPAFFREFLKDWNAPLQFEYPLNTVVLPADALELDSKLMDQYTSMWQARPAREEIRKMAAEKAAQQAKVLEATPEPERLNLFDEVAPGSVQGQK